nr:hypothetical protein [uncultured Tolumonas sp.]
MDKLNTSFCKLIEFCLDNTSFSISDFIFSETKGNALLHIKFKHHDDFFFIVTEENRKIEDPISRTSIGWKTFHQVRQSPGEIKKIDVFEYNLSKVTDKISEWCALIDTELTYIAPNETNEELIDKIENTINFEFTEPTKRFTPNEIKDVSEQLDLLFERISELQEEINLSEQQLINLKNEIELSKRNTSKYTKAIWSGITKSKLTKIIIEIAKSTEARQYMLEVIKRITFGGS